MSLLCKFLQNASFNLANFLTKKFNIALSFWWFILSRNSTRNYDGVELTPKLVFSVRFLNENHDMNAPYLIHAFHHNILIRTHFTYYLLNRLQRKIVYRFKTSFNGKVSVAACVHYVHICSRMSYYTNYVT